MIETSREHLRDLPWRTLAVTEHQHFAEAVEEADLNGVSGRFDWLHTKRAA